MDSTQDEIQAWAELSASEVLAALQQIAIKHNGSAVSGFLDTHQWIPLQGEAMLHIDGGHATAQYRRVSIGETKPEIAVWKTTGSALPDGMRTARQLRAFLYRNGVPDSCIGDIFVDNHAVLAMTPSIDPGGFGADAERLSSWPAMLTTPKRSTASATRMDAVVSTVFNVSRGEAQTAIEYGFIFCNFQAVAKRTHAVKSGDQLVYRTKGRCEIIDVTENKRSGRMWIEYRAYPS